MPLKDWKTRAKEAKAAAREARARELQETPRCSRCGLLMDADHECLPRAEGFLRERNGNRSY